MTTRYRFAEEPTVTSIYILGNWVLIYHKNISRENSLEVWFNLIRSIQRNGERLFTHAGLIRLKYLISSEQGDWVKPTYQYRIPEEITGLSYRYVNLYHYLWENRFKEILASGGRTRFAREILQVVPSSFFQFIFGLTDDVHVAREFLIELICQQPIKLMLFDLIFLFWISRFLPAHMPQIDCLAIEHYRLPILQIFQLSKDAYLTLDAEYLELQHLINLVSRHTRYKIERQRQEEFFRFQCAIRGLKISVSTKDMLKLNCLVNAKVGYAVATILKNFTKK